MPGKPVSAKAMARVLAFLLVGLALLALATPAAAASPAFTASGSAAGSVPGGAMDGDRFSAGPAAAWKGEPGGKTWWWQVRFPEPRTVGALLQVQGDQPLAFRNAPRSYVWQASADGKSWEDLAETKTARERRLFRIHRLKEPRAVRFLRLRIDAAHGEYPTLREVEVYADAGAAIPFPDWIVTVSTREAKGISEKPDAFTRLARQCKGWEEVPAQQVWLGDFDEAFVSAEPRPLCAFLSGNFKDWCQRTREPWRGTQEVLAGRRLPIWAACGGAQGLAILTEAGVDREWDCPHCRDPKNPKLPVYTHLGHTGKRPCGDYSLCLDERGKFQMLRTAEDPAFAGLPREFAIMESHCGQIAYVPKGWVRVVTKGPGARTVNQCLRVKDRYIYAAQFHMEMGGTPGNSRQIMGNFLKLARDWGGYNPEGKAVPEPTPLPGMP